MIFGVVERESLEGKLPESIDIVKESIEEHPESETSPWHVLKVRIAPKDKETVFSYLTQHMKPDWYALFWDNKHVYALFAEKTFTLTRENVVADDYDEMKEFAYALGLLPQHVMLERTIQTW